MIDELKMVHKVEYFCRNKLHAWFKPRGIRPYGKCRRLGDGYTLWGTKKVKGVDVSNLYYVDETEIAKWRGEDIGWRTIITNKKDPNQDFVKRKDDSIVSSRSGKRRKWNKVKMVHKGNVKIFNSLDEACIKMKLNRGSLINFLNTNKEYKGMLFYRIYEEEED